MYAWWSKLKPHASDPRSPSQWVREDAEPYRVIVFDTAEDSEKERPMPFESREYDGDLPTVPWREYLAGLGRPDA